MSHGVHRGYEENLTKEKIINFLIKKTHLKFNVFGMNNVQQYGEMNLKKTFIIQKLH